MYRSRPMIGRAGEEEEWTCMLRCVCVYVYPDTFTSEVF